MGDALNDFQKGIVGGIMGFISGIILNAFLPVFSTLYIPPTLWVAIILVPVIDFIFSILEGISIGMFYSIGVLLAEFLVNDLGTIVIGLLSIIGLIAGVILHNRS